MKQSVFLQARLDSSRLPAKAVLSLGGKPVISLCMEALSQIRADSYHILTDSQGAHIFHPFAQNHGFSVFEGPKEDVLERFVQAVDLYKTDVVIRATGDNPLVSAEASRLVLGVFWSQSADYAVMEGLPSGGCVEVVKSEALKWVSEHSRDPYEREHVCPGVYRRPEMFKVIKLPAPPHLAGKDYRVTLDTIEDYLSLSRLFGTLYQGTPISMENVIEYYKGADAVRAEGTGK